jgi:hypothetical protein
MSDATSLPVDAIIYQIPLQYLPDYCGRRLIVRSDDPAALASQLGGEDLNSLAYVQLCGLPSNADVMVQWARGLGIDLILDQKADQFARLYHYAKLLDNHPVRVSLPVVPGFEKAVKLAWSLQFAVRLQVGQPAALLLESLACLLDDYLLRSQVSQPIDYFHSVLLGFCHQEPVNLWGIQEEDPALVRFVDDRGRQRLPGRLAGADFDANTAAFVDRWAAHLLAAGGECAQCPFFASCRGYFKWPRSDYDCAGVKALFRTLEEAADRLRADLASASRNPPAQSPPAQSRADNR